MENMKKASTAIAYDLGGDGIIVKLSLTEAKLNSKKRCKLAKPLSTLVVLDHSGSMGKTVPAIVQQVLPEVLSRLGVPETGSPVELVAFETKTTHQTLDVAQLRKSPLKDEGGTYMASAVREVGEILSRNPTTPYRLIVISDGQITDKVQTLDAASRLEGQLTKQGRNAPVQVVLIRALTSQYASPDTRALACLGQLNTDGVTVLLDCPFCLCSTENIRNVTEVLFKTLKEGALGSGNSRITRTVTCGAKGLTRLPGAPNSDNLQVLSGESFIVLPPGTDPNLLCVDNEPIEVTKADLTSEDTILPLLLYLESHVKQLMVIGNSEARVKQLLDWVGRVSSKMCQDDAEAKNSPSIVARRNLLLRKVAQRTRSVVGRLRALANVEAVSQLNSERQAEFLRGVGCGAQGKALARRAAKVDSGDIEALVQDEIRALRAKVIASPLPENRQEPISFYGHDTLPGVLNSLADANESDLESLTVAEILQVVGPLGFTYHSKFQNDCPDPWSCFQLNEIFLGDSTYLNSADLWTSRTQAGQGHTSKLNAPGTEVPITGVIPVRHLSPQAYDLLSATAPTLLSLQAAASLRGALVRMPGDLQAMVAAGAIHLARKNAEKPTEAGSVALYALLKDMHAFRESKTLGIWDSVSSLRGQDPRPFLAGDLFIASGLKPLAAVLAGAIPLTPQLARAILGYSLYISAGKKYKLPEDRKAALHSILSIDSSKNLDPGSPGTPDVEDARAKVCKEYDAAVLRKRDDLRAEHDIEEIESVAIAVHALEDSKSREEFFQRFKQLLSEARELKIFGTSSEEETQDLAGGLALQAIRSPALNSRIDIDTADPKNRRYKFPDIVTSKDVEEYVAAEAEAIYWESYTKALKDKRNAEEAERCMALIQHLLDAPTLQEFISLLSPATEPAENTPSIPNRSAPGYPKLMDGLMDVSKPVPERLMKLWVMLLGRDREGEAVWCSGNVLREDMMPYQKLFVQVSGNEGNDLWHELRKIREKFGLHRYRESNVPNRHGHSNLLPSWWALGYNSPDAFKAAQPKEFEEYVKKRKTHVSWMARLQSK